MRHPDPSAPEAVRALAARLRDAMREAGYPSQRELSKAAKLSASTVSDALAGRHSPSWETISAILKACGVPATRSWAAAQEAAKTAEAEESRPPDRPPTPEPNAQGFYSVRPPLGVLPARVRGRDDLLRRLQDRLSGTSARIQVLHGLGGCGKTTIALELSRLATEADQTVFWVAADRPERISTLMREIAIELGVDQVLIDRAWSGQASAMDLLWSALDHAPDRWLLVFDNADEPRHLAAAGAMAGEGTGWVRASAAGTTVITTRIGLPEMWGSQADRHAVTVLDPGTAADVLVDQAGHAGTRRDALALADRLGGLPLALASAGRYLARSARGAGLLRRTASARITTFDSYREALGEIGPELLDERSPTENQQEELHRRLVGRTWELSLNLLESQGVAGARGLMRLLSCFAAAPFPVDLLEADALVRAGVVPGAFTGDDLDRALEALVDLSMLEAGEIGDVGVRPEPVFTPVVYLAAHRLVLESAAQRLKNCSDSEQVSTWRAAAAALDTATALAPEVETNWSWWRLIAPHVLSALLRLPPRPSKIGETLEVMINSGLRAFAYLVFNNDRGDAATLIERVRELAESLPGEHSAHLVIRHRYALIFATDPEARSAELAAILAEQRRVLGDRHPETLITWHDWASTLEGEEQERQFAGVLAARREVLGELDPYTVLTHRRWAIALADTGHEAEAEAALRGLLGSCREQLGIINERTLATMSALARVMDLRGHSDAVLSEYNQLFAHPARADEAGNRLISLETRHQLAHSLDRAGRYEEAENEYHSLLEELEERDEASGSRFHDLQACLARNLHEQKRFEDANSVYERILSSPVPPSPEFVLRLRHERADLLGKLDRDDEAVQEISSVLSARLAAGASDEDSVVLTERHCLAHTYERVGRLEDAEQELRAVSETFGRILDPTAKQARTAGYCHGLLLEKLARYEAAETVLGAIRSAEARALGSDDPETLVTAAHLAVIRHARGKLSGAEAKAELETLLPRISRKYAEGSRSVRYVRRAIADLDLVEPA